MLDPTGCTIHWFYKIFMVLLLLLPLLSHCSHVWLCDPIDGSPPGSPVPGILQARTLEWVVISFSNAWSEKSKWSCSVVSDSSRPHGLQPNRLLCPWDFPDKSTGMGCHGPNYSYIFAFLLTQLISSVSYIFSLTCVCTQLLQSCLTLWDHMGSPGSSVHGILQARILEWVAMLSSRRSSWPRDQSHVSCIAGRIFTTEPPGKPIFSPSHILPILSSLLIHCTGWKNHQPG